MNNLSWFMYLADILPNVQNLFGLIGGISLVLMLIGAFICLMEDEVQHSKTIFKYICLPILLITAACFIPSTQAMYLIAGSEAGEMVVTSQEGKEILGDIKDVIRTQLNELKKVD